MYTTPLWVVQSGVFLVVTVLQGLFWSQVWAPGQLPLPLVIAALLVSLAAAWLAGWAIQIWRDQSQLKNRLGQSEEQLLSMKAFLGGSLRMDAGLLEAASEEQVMDLALGVITELTGARGASFVPLDEWGQPLPAFIHGKLPAPVLRAWTEHLASHQTREVCKACQKHQSLPGSVCPLVEGPFTEVMGVYCFPLERGKRLLGMVNLYMPGKPALNDEQTAYLRGMLGEAALAVESIRMRNRELSTLRQVQMLRTPKSDLQALLGTLLEGMQQVAEADSVQLLTRESVNLQPVSIQIEHGHSDLLRQPEAERVRLQVLSSGQACLPGGSSACDRHFAGLPLSLPDGKTLGVMLLAGKEPLQLDERKLSILLSAAGQATLLIENEREMLSLEYRTVIQERARLAREIHDGLAQTLAVLKLQAAQMQIYLSQGNMQKLGMLMKQNYDTLAEAYLDTRQAIDDLRINPQQGLMMWLEQVMSDFESTTGIKVERSINLQPQEISPEVQAQLVRIVQEAFNNIRKHAHASHVLLSLRVWNGDLVLEVHDDGQGFSPEDVPGLSQYGLRGMRERAELIGADFQVVSKAPQGTTIRLSLPVRSQETMV